MLKGLNFYKDKQDPVAMADEEYPAWLWRVLDKTSADVGGVVVDEGDLYGMFSAFPSTWGVLLGQGPQIFLFCSALLCSALEKRCAFWELPC